jgi:hypothetical protein
MELLGMYSAGGLLLPPKSENKKMMTIFNAIETL